MNLATSKEHGESALQPSLCADWQGHWIWDCHEQRLELAPGWWHHVGDADEEASTDLGWWEARVHPDDRAAVRKWLADQLAHPNRRCEVELRVRYKDGSWHWILAQGALALADRSRRLSGSVLDITKRKLAELDTQRANRLLSMRSEANRVLLRVTEEQALLTKVCRLAVETGGYRMAWIGFRQEDALKTVWPVAEAGFVAQELESVQFSWDPARDDLDPAGVAICNGQPCVARATPDGPDHQHWQNALLRSGYRASLALPLAAGDSVLGVFCVYAGEDEAFSSAEIEQWQGLAEDVAFGLGAIRERAERDREIQALRRSERRLADAERVSNVGYFERDLRNNVLTWSDETYRIFGLKPQERKITHAAVQSLIHPEDRAATATRVAEALRLAARCEVEYRLVRPDGEVRVVYSQGDITRDESGQPLRMFGTVQDVTDRKRAEAALRRQDRMNYAMFNQAMTCFLLMDRGYRIVQVNAAYARHYGKSPEAFVGRGFFEVMSGYQVAEAESRKLLAEVIRTRQPHVWVDRPYLFVDQPTRGVTYWDSTLQPILDERGEVEFLFLSSIDVTERHRAEEQARRHTKELNRVMSSVSDYLWSAEVDPQGRWTYGYYSPVVEKITGRPPEFYMRDPSRWLSTVHPDDRWQMQEVFVQLAARQLGQGESEYRVVLPDGSVRWVRDSWTVSPADGGGLRINGVVGDITARKEAEGKLQSLLDHFPDFVARYDTGCRHVYVNPALVRELAASPDRFLGQTPVEAGLTGHGDADAALLGSIGRAFSTGEPEAIEVAWATAQGERCFEVRHLPEKDESGRIVSVLGISRDVTKQRQAEQGLQKVLRHARTIVMRFLIEAPEGWEQQDVAWATTNFRWTAHTYDEATAQEVLPVEQPPGMPYDYGWGLAKHPDDKPQMARTAHHALLTGASNWSQQFRCIDRHGRLHWFAQQSSIETAGPGRWRVTTINTDITERKLAEDALHEREEEFRALAENSPDIICRYDRHARITYGNPALEQLLGCPIEQVLGTNVLSSHPDNEELKAYYDKVRRVMETGAPDEHELILDFLPDAHPPIHYVRLVPERDRSGRITSVLGMGRDVSAIKDTERKLRASEERFATVFHTSPTAICVVRSADDRFVDVNEAFVQAIGATREEIIGRTALELRFWGDPTQREAWIRALREKGTVEGFKFNGRKKNGEEIVGLGATARITLNGEEHYLSLIHDITVIEKAEAALRESEQRFRQVTENIDEVFWLTDVEKTRMIYISPAYERVWGCGCESLYAEPRAWMDAIYGEDRERVRQAAFTLQAKGDYDIEYRIVRPDGSMRWIHDRAFPIRDAAGNVFRIAGVAEDVTGRRQLEEQIRQAQKMEAVGQLAGGIAHDFNNLLVVIQVQSSLLMEDLTDPEDREGVQQIVDAAERAANLTRQLLTFSRRDVKQASDIDLGEVIETMMKLLRRILGEDVVLVTCFAPALPPVNADPGMMEQVLMNLAVNARDAMPDGGQLTVALETVTLDAERLATRPQAVPGSYVCLTVSDTGCGIAAESMPRIFEPFFTTKDVGRGTGLGLATVFGIVQQHRGWIEVESAVGRGTTFRVYLPAVAAGVIVEESVHDATAVRGGAETILLVEDDPEVRGIGRSVLTRYGYRVLEASSAAAALAVWEARSAPIDLVLTDLVMPGGMSGRELAERLAELEPDLKIMYTSGYSDEIVDRTLRLDQGRNFLQKPYVAHELAEGVRRCLDEG